MTALGLGVGIVIGLLIGLLLALLAMGKMFNGRSWSWGLSLLAMALPAAAQDVERSAEPGVQVTVLAQAEVAIAAVRAYVELGRPAFTGARALDALFLTYRGRAMTRQGFWKLIGRYAVVAGIRKRISPHKLRHFLLTWLKKQGIDDALIQPYSGHAHRQSLEVYSRLAIEEAQQEYDQVIGRFPV